MRYLKGIVSLVAVMTILCLGSCTNEPTEVFDELENRSLKAWMMKNRADLVPNYQEDGAYYVEVLEAGEADSMSIHDVIADKDQGDCWLFFDVTGRSLYGDVCLTRNGEIARMQGSFSKVS